MSWRSGLSRKYEDLIAAVLFFLLMLSTMIIFITLNFQHNEVYDHSREIVKYIAVVGGYGYNGLQGHWYSYGLNSRYDTPKGWREWRLRRCACSLRIVSDPAHPYAGYAVGLPPPPLQNQKFTTHQNLTAMGKSGKQDWRGSKGSSQPALI